MPNSKQLETAPYKGVRDFYPEDMFTHKYLAEKMRKVAENFGYVEYSASILESAELYRAKSGQEIVAEQTYTFKDRGEREVTLRPEITPTLARMVAQKRTELSFPLRWYSIPNLFRYERPQKGRLREHFQLNVDILGVSSEEADIEIIRVASELMKKLGAKPEDFEIRINDRRINERIYDEFSLSVEQRQKISKVIDKKEKISKESFQEAAELVLAEKTEEFLEVIGSNQKLVKRLGEDSLEIKKLTGFIEVLDQFGIKNVKFDQNLVRGFDYYTGLVFEIYDANPENKRSLFGGGRYDELLEIFGKEKVPAVGFGMGDVTILEFLESRNLLPQFENPTSLYICRLDKKVADKVEELAEKFRQNGINTAVDLTDRKIGDQIKSVAKQKIPFIVCVGENEVKSGKYRLKNLATGEEKELGEEEMIRFLKN